MSVRVMTRVWDQSRSESTDRLVLLAIADSADDDGSNAWPSVSTIARKVRVSERTVQRSVRALCELGELRVEAQRGGTPEWRDDRRPNRYTVLLRGDISDTPRVDGVTSGASRGDTGDTQPVLDPSIDMSIDSEFEGIWVLYPRRVKRASALKAYRATRKRGESAHVLLGCVQNYVYHCARENLSDRFVMHCSSFFGPDERWREHLTAPTEPFTPEIDRSHHPPEVGRCGECGYLEWDCVCGKTLREAG